MPDDYEIYLTGKNNFRHEIAKSHVYKGNRKDTQKPIHLGHVRQYAIEKFGAIVSEGEEADDLIAIGATKYGKQTIVASIDKDMLQIPCTHFNFNRNEWTDVDEWDGLKFFYTQILTGDSADNIIGLYKVGPVKAGKILDGAESEEELWDRCVDAYDGDAERVLENARLLWLRRYEGELWQPPDMR
jgi:5'-3' exonuclease